jgi:hypothetical protein
MSEHNVDQDLLRIAETIRAACLAAALESYEDASIRGLCHEGAWECAIGAIRTLNVRRILAHHLSEFPPASGTAETS